MEEDIEAGRRELLDDGGVVGVTIPRVFNGTVERVALEALFERNVEDGNVKSDCMVLRERGRERQSLEWVRVGVRLSGTSDGRRESKDGR